MISIAICTWNRADALVATLDGLRGLTIPAGLEWEVLVVNNACTDHTDEVLQTWQARLPLRRLFEPRSGQSFARNLALRASNAEFILWTDDDVIVDANWVTSLLDGFDAWHGDIVFGRSVPQWTGKPPVWFSPLHYGRFAVLDHGNEPFVVTSKATSFYGLNFAARRQVLVSLGGFDETLGYTKKGGAAGEDNDLFQRALESRFRIVYVPNAVVRHVIPPIRATKQFYRDRLASAAARDYERLRQDFAGVRWAAGLPRFMFRRAATDALGYLVSTATRAHDRAFDYELKVRRFAGYWRAALRRMRSTALEASKS